MPRASHLYPNLLVDVQRYVDVPDTTELEGGRILIFRDNTNALVELRLRRQTADRLLKIMESGPAPVPEQSDTSGS